MSNLFIYSLKINFQLSLIFLDQKNKGIAPFLIMGHLSLWEVYP
jgi:hypothetical protein